MDLAEVNLPVGIRVHKAQGRRVLPKEQQREDKGTYIFKMQELRLNFSKKNNQWQKRNACVEKDTSREFSRFPKIQLVWEV